MGLQKAFSGTTDLVTNYHKITEHAMSADARLELTVSGWVSRDRSKTAGVSAGRITHYGFGKKNVL